MSSQTVSRRPRRVQKRSKEVSKSSQEADDADEETGHNEGVEDAAVLSAGAHTSPRRRLASHHMSPRRKFERSPVRRPHHVMPKPPLQESPTHALSPKTRSKGSAEMPRDFPNLDDVTSSQHTSSRRRRPAIGKLTIRIEQLKAENLMAVAHHMPLEIKTDSVKNMGETLVNTLKQPTNLTRAILKAPDALMKTPANVVSKTSEALKKSADAFVQLHYFDYGWKSGPKTSIQRRTCSPEWTDEVLELQLGADAAQALLKSGERLELRLWSHDAVAVDTFLGSVQIPILSEDNKNVTTYRVLKRSPNDSSLQSHHVTGELTAHVSLHAEAVVELHRGALFPLQKSKITLGVSCRKSHVESSVVVLNRQGQVMWSECAYNDNCVTDALNISYNDSESKDLLYYHMDRCIINLDLEALPDEATALFVVVYVPSDEASLQVRILETESKVAVARYAPHSMKESHSLVLARLARYEQGWFLTPIGESFARVQDFGSLLPAMNTFMHDVTAGPGSHNDATVVLCKQRPIFLRNDTEQWKLFVSWNEKESDGRNAVFSTLAILLDGDFHAMDQVDATVDSSRRGGVIYIKGWRPKRSEKFEDFLVEKIEAVDIQSENVDMMNDFTDEFVLNLSKLSARVRHVCFSVTVPSKTVQTEACGLEKVTLRLHDDTGQSEFARFASPVQSESGLLLACFSRRDNDLKGSWVFEVASLASSPTDMGKRWKSFFADTKHSDPYEIVAQHSKEMNLEFRNMPTLTVVDAKPTAISNENLLKSLG